MENYINLYLEWCRLRGQAEDTIYRKRVLLREIDTKLNLQTATKGELEMYVLKRYDGCAASLYNGKISILRSFFEWLYENDYITKNPAKGLKDKKNGFKFQKWFTQEEIEKVLNIPKTPKWNISEYLKYQLAFEMIAYTGIRRSELINAKKDDVFQNESGCYMIVRRTKNKDDRIVPLPPLFTQRLFDYMNMYSQVYIFETKTHRQLTRGTLTKTFERRLKKVGLYEKGLGLHGLRRGRITRLIENHADNAGVMLIAGHKKMETTMRYFYYSMGYIQEQAAKDPLFKNN